MSNGHLQALAEAMASGNGRVLVGAASSIACGYPGWGDFLNLLANEVDSDQPTSLAALDFATRADELQEALSKSFGSTNRFTDIFQYTFHPSRATKKPPEWLRFLFQLELPLYITTNYTCELEVISKEFGFKDGLRWHQQGVLELLRNLGTQYRVLYLHGRYDDDPIYRRNAVQVILGEQSYKATYESPGRVADILTTVLATGTLLIVGASLEDEDIKLTLRRFSARVDPLDRTHYVILPLWPEGHKKHQNPNALEIQLLKKYFLQPIFFDVLIDPDGKPVFDKLQLLVKELLIEVQKLRARRVAPGDRERDNTDEAFLVSALTRLLPSPRDFREIASSIGIDTPRSVLRRSPMDRWYSLVAATRRAHALEKLREVAQGRLPPRRIIELSPGHKRGKVQLTDRVRVSSFLDSLAAPYFGPLRNAPPDQSSYRAELGLLALDRYWGDEPINPQIEEWRSHLNGDAVVYQNAVEKGVLTNTGEFTNRAIGIAVAADFITRRCAEKPTAGRDLIAWALPRLAECQANRYEILIHFVAWLPEAGDAVVSFLESEILNPGTSSLDHLLALTFAERLQREAGLPPLLLQIPTPIAVQWAKRAGLQAFVASVLEILGEERMEVYLKQWREVTEPARIALARAIRRIALHGPPVGEPVLDRAIEATRPEVSVDRIIRLVTSLRVRKVWLDILPLDPEANQIQALGELLIKGSGRRTDRIARRSAERLSEHPDLTLVWDTLGSRRRAWIERLEPARVPQIAIAALLENLQNRTLPKDEKVDLERLCLRLKQRPTPNSSNLSGA